jgi:hypothetical protein
MQNFKRPHHQKIAKVLQALNGPLLKEHECYFAGGTAMALRYGEYRESVDIDFLISNLEQYRTLRELLTSPAGISGIVRTEVSSLQQIGDIRADQYGIRTKVQVGSSIIKFEIVLEWRIALATPGAKDEICGITTLCSLDMASSKLLANADRWRDDGVFSRDIIDLAMMDPSLSLLQQAVAKAEKAYGQSILQSLIKAINRLQDHNNGWLDRCMMVMDMNAPKAVVWKQLNNLMRVCQDG